MTPPWVIDKRTARTNTVPMGETRSRILDAARELFVREGLEAFSMRRVAERSELAVSALYRHFEDKDALLAALLETSFGSFAGTLMRALDAPTPLEQFRAMLERYFEFALDHPQDYALMFLTRSRDLGFDKLGSQTRDLLRSSFKFMAERIEDCIEAGVFAPGDPEAKATLVWAQAHGLVSLHSGGQLGAAFPKQFRILAQESIEQSVRALCV